jgi:hypothetical protein
MGDASILLFENFGGTGKGMRSRDKKKRDTRGWEG